MSLAQVQSPQQAPPPAKISIDHPLKEQFVSDRYQIEQPYIQITKEGYNISSADKSEAYSASRPRHIFRSLFGRMVGVGAFLTVFFISFMALGFMSKGLEAGSAIATIAVLFSMALGFGGGYMAFGAALKVIAPLRVATVVDSRGNKMMVIEPTSRHFIFNSEYLIRDAKGTVLATFSRDFIESIFQTHWHCRDFRGKYMFSATEDSLILSLLRRYLNLARFIPMTFRFSKGRGKPFGEFRRGYSLRDKYKLDYNPAAADGWLVVASAILLDTGEGR